MGLRKGFWGLVVLALIGLFRLAHYGSGPDRYHYPTNLTSREEFSQASLTKEAIGVSQVIVQPKLESLPAKIEPLPSTLQPLTAQPRIESLSSPTLQIVEPVRIEALQITEPPAPQPPVPDPNAMERVKEMWEMAKKLEEELRKMKELEKLGEEERKRMMETNLRLSQLLEEIRKKEEEQRQRIKSVSPLPRVRIEREIHRPTQQPMPTPVAPSFGGFRR